jgi:hypothetical protein
MSAVSVQKREDKIGELFESPPTYIADSSAVVDWCTARGLPTERLEDYDVSRRGDVVLICSAWATYRHRPALERRFAECAVLFVPLAAFGDGLAAHEYTLAKLIESDPAASVARQRDRRAALARQPTILHFVGPGTDIALEVPDKEQLCYTADPALRRGDFRSAALYFELSFEISGAQRRSPGTANGFLTCDGLLAARNHRLAAADQSLFEAALELQQSAAEAGRVEVDIESNSIVSCRWGGQDRSPQLERVAGELGRKLTEFSVGVNEELARSPICWQYNSQLNEGAAGIHIGVGIGVGGAHVDLVCTNAQLAETR